MAPRKASWWPQSNSQRWGLVVGAVVVVVVLAMVIAHAVNQPDRNSVSYIDGYHKGKSMVSIATTLGGSEGPSQLNQSWVDSTCEGAVYAGDNARDFIAGCHDGWRDAYQQWKYHGRYGE